MNPKISLLLIIAGAFVIRYGTIRFVGNVHAGDLAVLYMVIMAIISYLYIPEVKNK